MTLQPFKFMCAACLILSTACRAAPAPVGVSEIVAAQGVDPASSTLLIERASDGARWISNAPRAGRRFPAASTSKIPHLLIALETEAATPDTLFQWDGQVRFLDSWNQDQTLESAFQRSAVWVFQSITSQLGRETMAAWLDKLSYGNEATGDDDQITRYWLDGTLRISAAEQVEFLHRAASRDLPLSPKTFEAGLPMMIMDRSDAGDGPIWKLYGKTGLFAPGDKTEIGWFVGWLETAGHEGDERYAFAFNMDMPTREELPKRVGVVRAVLTELGVTSRAK